MTQREILILLAKVAMVGALLMTGMGGLIDISKNDYTMTKKHLWNDGLILAIVAIFLLLLART